MSADDALAGAIAAVQRALDAFGAPYMVIGGIAIVARGVVRLTDDVDATVWGEEVDVDDLLRALETEGVLARIPDAAEFAKRRQVLLLRHAPTGSNVDISLAWLPFEREALDRAEPVDLRGATVPVATAEDLIVFKAVAWRDQDRADVEALLRLHGAEVDMTRVRRLVREFSEALEAPERIAEFELVVRRAREG